MWFNQPKIELPLVDSAGVLQQNAPRTWLCAGCVDQKLVWGLGCRDRRVRLRSLRFSPSSCQDGTQSDRSDRHIL